jgi:CRISPR system Cascade subunit CasD
MEVSLQKAEVIANAKGLVEAFRVVDGTVLGEESLVIADVPLSFGERKRYRQRIVTVLNAQ